MRRNRGAGKRFALRTVTRHYRDIIDIGLCIAGEAEAVGGFLSEIEGRRTNLRRRFFGRLGGLGPAVELLWNVFFVREERPDLTCPRRRRVTRALHVAPVYVGDRPAVKNRTFAVHLREHRGAAAGDVDLDHLSCVRTGGGGAESIIPVAELEIVISLIPAGSRHWRCK